MSDLLNEQLSSLLDGELPPEQTTLLLKRLGREPELALRLRRYRLCGDVLRGERVQPRSDFAVRVSAAVAAEAPLPAPAARAPQHRWRRPLAGLAVAASVATAALLVLRQLPAPNAPQPLAAAVRSVPPAAVQAAYPQPVGGEPASYVTPAARPAIGVIPSGALANYVVAHSQFNAPLAGRSVLIHLVADESRDEAPAR